MKYAPFSDCECGEYNIARFMTTYIYEYNTVQQKLMLKNVSSKINTCDRKILKVFHKYIVLEFVRGKISI